MLNTVDQAAETLPPSLHSRRDRVRTFLRGFQNLPPALPRFRAVLLVLARYGFAVALVALAVATTFALRDLGIDKDETHFGFYVVIVAIASARIAGAGPAGLSIILSTIAVRYFFGRPIPDQLPWFITVVFAALVALLWDAERRRAESVLRRERDELDAKVRERSAELERVLRVAGMTELISVTHEISQPLTAISTNAGAAERWLAQDPPAVHQARASLGLVTADIGRASGVLDRVRAFSRQHIPCRGPTAINDVIHQALVIAHAAVERQGVSISSELGTALPPVAGDQVQLQQVLLNLINNGVEAMSSVMDRPRLLTIRSRLDSTGGIAVEVDDSGTGIEPDKIGEIFEKFYTTKAAGLGMGLPISRAIIEAHGGRLWASPLDRGTRFQFTLPATAPEET